MSNVNRRLSFENGDQTPENKTIEPMQPLIDFKQLSNFLIQNVPTRDEAIQTLRIYSDEGNQGDPLSIIFKIDEVLRPFDIENLRKFSEIPKKSNVIAFQSTFDGKFCVVWKLEKIWAMNVLDDIKYEDLIDLCKFLVKFLSKCIKENHSALSKSKMKSASKYDLTLTSLIDSNGLNLLHCAAQSGNTKIVKILLENGFNVNMWCSRRLPADRAYENHHFSTLLELLKADSQLPKDFKINECPSEIQEFVRAKNGGRDKSMLKKSTIFMSILLYTIVLLPFVAFFIFIFVYDPKILWKDLNEVQRAEVLNGSVKFFGINAKFSEIFNVNDTNLLESLTYEQILILMRQNVLDLNKDENQFLESEIYLNYANMSDNLKEKLVNSEIDFQGNLVTLETLIEDNEEIYDSLSSSKIVEFLRNGSLMSIGRKFEEISDENWINLENLTFYSIENHKNFSISSKNLLTGSQDIKLILLANDGINSNFSIVKNFPAQLKQNFPQFWIEYIDLKSQSSILEKIIKSKLSVEEILSKILMLKSQFELEILKKFISNREIVIFWHGFDEISLNFIDFLFDLFLRIKNDTQNIQFVTTHPQYEPYISGKFANKVHKLFF